MLAATLRKFVILSLSYFSILFSVFFFVDARIAPMEAIKVVFYSRGRVDFRAWIEWKSSSALECSLYDLISNKLVRVYDSKWDCLLRIFLYLESRFRSLRWVCVIWFFERGTWTWSSWERSISHLGGSPTSTDQPKSREAR